MQASINWRSTSEWLAAAALTLTFLFQINPVWASNDLRPADMASGSLLFKDDKGSYVEAPRLAADLQIDVAGMLAKVTLKQTFRNDSSEWLEGIYVFPLPDDAAVNRMVMQIGERRIVGKIREKQKAKRLYAAAKKAGKRVSLVEQERPNLFTNSVANIGPGEEVTVEISYLQTARYDSGRFSLRFPMTVTPRYVPGQPLSAANGQLSAGGSGWAEPTTLVPDADRVTPPVAGHEVQNPIRIQARLDVGFELAKVESLYHPVLLDRTGEQYQVQLAAGQVPMDRDFELQWQPVLGKAPRGALFTETVAGEHYAMLMLLPPEAVRANPLPRELLFVIDTSGSMAGSSMVQAKAALQTALNRLGPQDQFDIVKFNTEPTRLFAQPRTATVDNIAAGQDFVEMLEADGGTEIGAALDMVMSTTNSAEHLRQIVFITDGSVANENALLSKIKDELGDGRLFTVAIGSAPNRYFMRKAAQMGRGTFTMIGKIEEVQSRTHELFTKLEQPVLSDVRVQWPAEQADIWPQYSQDLYQGEPLMLAARVSSLTGQVTIKGELAGTDWQQVFTLGVGKAQSGVATVWARRKIEGLLDEKIAGADAAAIRKQVLAVGLNHQLLTPYTSFIAVDETPARAAGSKLHRKNVAGRRPAGSTAAYPKTATSAPLHMLLGTLSLLLLIGRWLLARRASRSAI